MSFLKSFWHILQSVSWPMHGPGPGHLQGVSGSWYSSDHLLPDTGPGI